MKTDKRGHLKAGLLKIIITVGVAFLIYLNMAHIRIFEMFQYFFCESKDFKNISSNFFLQEPIPLWFLCTMLRPVGRVAHFFAAIGPMYMKKKALKPN